jgi:hypothetical protein
MLYLLAAVGVIAVVVLLWRAFGPSPAKVAPPPRRRGPLAPDDDPEFLRGLGERKRPPDEDDKQPPG